MCLLNNGTDKLRQYQKTNQFPMMKLRNKKLIFCSTCFVLKATFCNLYQSVFTISDVKALKIDRMTTEKGNRAVGI